MLNHLTLPASVLEQLNKVKGPAKAGEWDIDIPFENSKYDLEQVRKIIFSVTQAFDWCQLETAGIAFANHIPTHCDWVKDEAIDTWITHLGNNDRLFNGIDGRLKARIETEDGQVAETAEDSIYFMASDIHQGYYTLSIVLYINVFTDTIRLYDNSIAESVAFDISSSAKENRQRLRNSLTKIQSLTGGKITEYSSEIIEGIEKCGFSEKAIV